MKKKIKNITRFDYNRSHGWWVRFEYRDHPISKLFSDSRYGGKRKALAAAREYRDEVLLTLPKRHHGPDVLPGPGRIWKERRSYLSLSGVRMYYNAWTAWIMVSPQHPASSNVSIDKWGVRRAKSRILIWLDQKRKDQKHNYYKVLGVRLP
jgi:hypothetical protein